MTTTKRTVTRVSMPLTLNRETPHHLPYTSARRLREFVSELEQSGLVACPIYIDVDGFHIYAEYVEG